MSRYIELDKAMERIEQIYKDMGVATYGIWNKQLAEILHFADVEDVRFVLHKIIGAVTQAPSIDIARCKECKHSPKNTKEIPLHDSCYTFNPNDFCSYGEREDNGIRSLEYLLPIEKEIVKEVDSAPTIDIVHCRECKNAHLTYDGECKYCECWKDDDDNYIELYFDGDFFCGFGKREGE